MIRPKMASALAAGLIGAGLQIGGFQQPRLAAGLITVGALGFVWEWWSLWHERQQELKPAGLSLAPEPVEASQHARFLAVRIFVEARTLIAVGAHAPHAVIYCANVNFRNDPVGSHPDTEVPSIVAEITFVHQGRQVVKITNGRWGDTDQPAIRQAHQPFSSMIDLNAVPFRIGETHELNIAVKHPNQAHFYAFDNNSYHFDNWENPTYRLTEPRYEVIVRLRGRHVDDEHHFLIRNVGVDAGLELHPLESASF